MSDTPRTNDAYGYYDDDETRLRKVEALCEDLERELATAKDALAAASTRYALELAETRALLQRLNEAI